MRSTRVNLSDDEISLNASHWIHWRKAQNSGCWSKHCISKTCHLILHLNTVL